MKFSVRKAVENDIPRILELIKELAQYERAPDEVMATEESMKRDGFGDHPLYEALVAEADGVVSGVAVFYACYSTWKGKLVYLDDLIVTESKRKLGIGRMLLDEVVRYAKNIGANQLRWHVLDWNTPAIDFYQSYQAAFDSTWVTCKLTREQLDTFQ
jgi:GNAT superfamily N-acetyltransferase